MSKIEFLTDPKNERLRLFPIQHEDIWGYYKKHLSSYWVAQEIDLSKDLKDWERLSENEKYYISRTLAFFASSDFIVNANGEVDRDVVTVMEYKIFNNDKMSREDIHSFTYALLIDTYIKDESEKNNLFDAIQNIPTIRDKKDWMMNYVNNGSFAQRTVACCIMEGIFFSSSFCSIFWLKKRGLMNGLCESNRLISKDEGLHRDCAAMIYRNYIVNKLSTEEIEEMIRSAVIIEQRFAKEALPVELIGMNSELMSQYIEYVADHVCMILISKRIYNTENPFDFLALLSMESKNDFFASRNIEYCKNSIVTKKEDNVIEFDGDF